MVQRSACQGDKSIGSPRRSNEMNTFVSTINPTDWPPREIRDGWRGRLR
jgi:hypothetical protein